jgi:hypothetical protein
MILDLGLLFLHMADVGEAGSAPEYAGEFSEGIGRAGGVDFHIAVGEVEDVPLQIQGGGCMLGEVAVSNALDSSLYDPASGGLERVRHGVARFFAPLIV